MIVRLFATQAVSAASAAVGVLMLADLDDDSDAYKRSEKVYLSPSPNDSALHAPPGQ